MRTTINRFFSTEPAFLSKDSMLLIFRVLVSVSMINTHGIKKLLNYTETVNHIPDPLGMGGEFSAAMAILANIIAPVFVILGLGTRLAVLPILGVTLIGLLVVHAADPWSVRDIPLMYTLAYGAIFFLGAGKYSLDHKFFKK